MGNRGKWGDTGAGENKEPKKKDREKKLCEIEDIKTERTKDFSG